MEAVAEKLENQTAATQAMREQLEAQSAELAAARASKNELASEVASLRAEKEATSHALSRQHSTEFPGSGVGTGIKRATGSGRLARVGVSPKHDVMVPHCSTVCFTLFAGLPRGSSLSFAGLHGCHYCSERVGCLLGMLGCDTLLLLPIACATPRSATTGITHKLRDP